MHLMMTTMWKLIKFDGVFITSDRQGIGFIRMKSYFQFPFPYFNMVEMLLRVFGITNRFFC
jgi:hypothetical protein